MRTKDRYSSFQFNETPTSSTGNLQHRTGGKREGHAKHCGTLTRDKSRGQSFRAELSPGDITNQQHG